MNIEQLAEQLLARQFANEAVMESLLLILKREKPELLDQIRARLDDYRPKARQLLSEEGSEVFEERVESLLLDLENLA